jgi:hypothetical protein
MDWISIRNKWPDKEGIYLVKDCRHNMFGKTYYDGYNFDTWKPTNPSLKGSLLLIAYTTTHWKCQPERLNPEDVRKDVCDSLSRENI